MEALSLNFITDKITAFHFFSDGKYYKYISGKENEKAFKSDQVIRTIIQEHSSSNPQSKSERSSIWTSASYVQNE